MKKGKQIIFQLWRKLADHKYLWTIVIFGIYIGFLSDDRIAKRIDIRADNAALRKEIKTYDDRYKQDSLRLDRMKNDPDALIRVARESHRMCASDEDVYIVTEE